MATVVVAVITELVTIAILIFSMPLVVVTASAIRTITSHSKQSNQYQRSGDI